MLGAGVLPAEQVCSFLVGDHVNVFEDHVDQQPKLEGKLAKVETCVIANELLDGPLRLRCAGRQQLGLPQRLLAVDYPRGVHSLHRQTLQLVEVTS